MAEALDALAGKLDADLADILTQRLRDAMKKTAAQSNFDFEAMERRWANDQIPLVGRALHGLRYATQAAGAGQRLRDAVEKTTDTEALGELAQGLAAMAGELGVARATKLAPHVLDAAASTSDLGVFLGLAKILDRVNRLSLADQAQLLKHPCCVGEARRLLLRRLEKDAGQKFATIWDLAAWLEKHHPEIDLSAPPRRPSR